MSEPEISPRAFCASCGVEIHAKGKFKKRFCSPACRALAWRSKESAAELAQLQEFADRVTIMVQDLMAKRASTPASGPAGFRALTSAQNRPAELD